MKTRVLVYVVLLLIVGAAVFFFVFPGKAALLAGWFSNKQTIWAGQLRGEPSYAGKPASWYARGWKEQDQGDVGKMLLEGGHQSIPVLIWVLHYRDSNF